MRQFTPVLVIAFSTSGFTPTAIAAALRPDSALVPWETQSDGTHSFLGSLSLPLPAAAMSLGEPERAALLALSALQNLAEPDLTLQPGDTIVHANGDVSVVLQQVVQGIPIEGAYATALLRDGVLLYARQRLVKTPTIRPLPQVTVAAADRIALADIRRDVESASRSAASPTELAVLLLGDAAHLVWKVPVSAPAGVWQVWVDAHDGTILGRHQVSQDGVSGHMRLAVEQSCTGDAPTLVGAAHMLWNGRDYTDAEGTFSSSQTYRQTQASLSSPYFRLINKAGRLAGPFVVPLAAAPAHNEVELTGSNLVPLDQADPFYHAHVARAWLRRHASINTKQKAWTQTQVPMNININQTCNAYWDPTAGSLNFFRAGTDATTGYRCLNTGRTAAIVYHEYGHGVHAHSGGRVDMQVGEGVADYIAATISNNPNIQGLYTCNHVFRSCVNSLSYCASGSCDVSPSTESHRAGQVICGALWELRQHLQTRLGSKAGVAAADRIYVKFLSLVGGLGSAYQAAIAADDDNDGNARNGTVHSCEINRAFLGDATHRAHFPESRRVAVPCNATLR